jgi:ribosomal protein S18 acetylase RimI-like enzyme
VLTVGSPGRTAMVFASRAESRSKVRSLGGLVDHAVRQLPLQNVNLAQALVEPDDALDREVFLTGGFSELAILTYMERPIRMSRMGRLPAPQWPPGYAAVTFQDSLRDELIGVLNATYEDTLDCPALRGHRRTSDILDGHRASGIFNPDLWTLLYRGPTAVGALLLNPSADHHSIELVYLGLAKSERGTGVGRQLLRHGLRLIEGRNERVITLAVDESNSPAVRLYEREGFRAAVRRRALIRPV